MDGWLAGWQADWPELSDDKYPEQIFHIGWTSSGVKRITRFLTTHQMRYSLIVYLFVCLFVGGIMFISRKTYTQESSTED